MAENYVLLETIALTQTTSSITFDNLPSSGYTDLKIVVSARGNRGGDGDYFYLSLNGAQADSGKTAKGTTSGTVLDNYLMIPSAGNSSNAYGNMEIYLPNYLNSTAKNVFVNNVVGDFVVASGAESIGYALWSTGSASTSAITSITLSGRFASIIAGSTFSLYALAATGTTPTFGPFASGGNIVANDGTYWYHAFTSTGNFVPVKSLTCDVLVVAGGGSGGVGGGSWGGGGGAGGYRTTLDTSALSFVKDTAYTCTIGAGGVSTVNRALGNTSGSNSSIIGGAISYSATGGGRGGSENSNWWLGGSGGSGGGGNYQQNPGSGNAGGYTPVEGYAGATARSGNDSSAGGGAGAAGSTKNGGAGRNTNSTWATATTTGVSGYFAGGGGSGDYPALTAGTGGSGGGGAGSPNGAIGVDGTASTGSGGGGGNAHGTYRGGNGGSGIIIIRYAMV
jgi:hypothetical protein